MEFIQSDIGLAVQYECKQGGICLASIRYACNRITAGHDGLYGVAM